jgi:hypothetical protein
VTGDRIAIVLVLVVAFAIRLGFAATLPVFQAPDEEAHFRYVEHLGKFFSLPTQPERGLELFADPMHQAYQPPLAYALFVPALRVAAASDASAAARLRVLRTQNALYGAVTVWIGVLVSARLTRRGDPRRLLTAIALAFLPGFAALGGAVNNDGLAILLAAVFWLTLIPAAGADRSAWRTGVVLAAACLAKLSNLALAPLLVVIPWWYGGRDMRGALRFAAVAAAVAVALMAPWFWHNSVTYGNPLAIGVGSLSFEWLATVLTPEQLAAAERMRLGNVLFQFFGRFGIANNLVWVGVPAVFIPLTLLGVFGWLRRPAVADVDAFDIWAPAWMLALALVSVALVEFSILYVGAWQGRYLYGALLPAALLFAGGTSRWLPAANARIALTVLAFACAAVDLVVLVKLARFFAERAPATWVSFTRL